MATFTTETTITRTRRWIIPAAEPWGAAAAEIGKAWAVAEKAYREQHGITDEQPLHDDALHFHVRDDEIVISFAVEEQQP
jgi:hypothetical protein